MLHCRLGDFRTFLSGRNFSKWSAVVGCGRLKQNFIRDYPSNRPPDRQASSGSSAAGGYGRQAAVDGWAQWGYVDLCGLVRFRSAPASARTQSFPAGTRVPFERSGSLGRIQDSAPCPVSTENPHRHVTSPQTSGWSATPDQPGSQTTYSRFMAWAWAGHTA